MKNDEQLTLFDGARNKLKQLGIKPHISELKQIENDLAELEKRESVLEKEYDSTMNETRDLEQKYRNITEYLGIDNDEKKKEQERPSQNQKNQPFHLL